MRSILLDTETWDLVTDASGNIAAADDPYALAQNAASAIKTFAGEVYFDTTLGLPYLTQIFGKRPSLALLRARFAVAAQTVTGVISAKCFISAFNDRIIGGQVQVIDAKTGQMSAANFTTINPQGGG